VTTTRQQLRDKATGRFRHQWGFQLIMADGRQVEMCDHCGRYTLDGGTHLVSTGSLTHTLILDALGAAGLLDG
jgi:hypothetical protein